jgi:hypothetical protein
MVFFIGGFMLAILGFGSVLLHDVPQETRIGLGVGGATLIGAVVVRKLRDKEDKVNLSGVVYLIGGHMLAISGFGSVFLHDIPQETRAGIGFLGLDLFLFSMSILISFFIVWGVETAKKNTEQKANTASKG